MRIFVRAAFFYFLLSSFEVSWGQSSQSLKRYENFGLCFGMADALARNDMETFRSLSPVAIGKIANFSKTFPFPKKWEPVAASCYSIGIPLEQIRSCVDAKIADINAAAYWKGYLMGPDYIFNKPRAVQATLVNAVCVVLE